MNTTWNITKLFCIPNLNGQQNVVANIEWKAVAEDYIDGNKYVAEKIGIIGSGFSPNITDFTPYNQLTEQQVLNWVWSNGISKEGIELTLQGDINNQINPPIVVPPLPWSQPSP